MKQHQRLQPSDLIEMLNPVRLSLSLSHHHHSLSPTPSAAPFSQTCVVFVQEEVEVIEDPVDTLIPALGNVLEAPSQSAVCPVEAP